MPEQTPNLNAALAAFQAELPRVTKGATGQVGNKRDYKYADLADVTEVALPLLAKQGLSFTAIPDVRDGMFGLRCVLRHSSGEEDSGFYPLPGLGTAPQQVGSAITYARRYALCAATGIAPDGDDDDAASAQQGHESFDDARPATRGSSWQAPANPHSRKADRSRGPMEDDPWASEVPTNGGRATSGTARPNGGSSARPSEDPEELPGSSTPQQHRDIAIRLGNRNITDRAERLAFCAEVTGRPIGSAKDLSYAEAARVLKLTEGANA